MHKKLEAELVSLAHSILQMKNKDDVSALQKKALEIYEKLSVLKYVDEYLNTPNEIEVKEKKIDTIAQVTVEEQIEDEPVIAKVEEVLIEEHIEDESVIDKAEEVLIEEQAPEIIEVKEDLIEENEEDSTEIRFTLEEEFKDAISADVATNLFEKATKENPVIEKPSKDKKRTLNDSLYMNNLQVGLNDRIAFVKHLFEGNQEDFNRVLSQLNSFKSEIEAKSFVNDFVKPDYDWNDKNEFEERLINLIERKFL